MYNIIMILQPSPASQLGTRLPIQDYDRARRQCLANGTLFEDPYFPPNNSSLFHTQKLPFTPKWLRPKVIHFQPGSIVVCTLQNLDALGMVQMAH